MRVRACVHDVHLHMIQKKKKSVSGGSSPPHTETQLRRVEYKPPPYDYLYLDEGRSPDRLYEGTQMRAALLLQNPLAFQLDTDPINPYVSPPLVPSKQEKEMVKKKKKGEDGMVVSPFPSYHNPKRSIAPQKKYAFPSYNQFIADGGADAFIRMIDPYDISNTWDIQLQLKQGDKDIISSFHSSTLSSGEKINDDAIRDRNDTILFNYKLPKSSSSRGINRMTGRLPIYGTIIHFTFYSSKDIYEGVVTAIVNDIRNRPSTGMIEISNIRKTTQKKNSV